jgi:nucleotide-binding universal stress UspA family protein
MVTELDARLVVIGSHGGSGAARFLLGSVAETILRQVPCTVMVVPLNRGGDANAAA